MREKQKHQINSQQNMVEELPELNLKLPYIFQKVEWMIEHPTRSILVTWTMNMLKSELLAMKPYILFIEKCFRIKNADHLNPQGDMDLDTEYQGRYNTAARKGDKRSKFRLKQDLITPYGNFAGSAVRLGDPKRYKNRAVSG